MSRPQRIQLSRRAGSRKPDGVIVVSRPSRWGNPWRVGETSLSYHGYQFGTRAGRYAAEPTWTDLTIPDAGLSAEMAVALYRSDLETTIEAASDSQAHPEDRRFAAEIVAALAELRGHDLGCFCPLDQPCHADVLLDLSNRAEATA